MAGGPVSRRPDVLRELKRAKRKGRTVSEMATALGISKQTAAIHLRALRRNGDAVSESVPAAKKETAGRGRPELVFRAAQYAI